MLEQNKPLPLSTAVVLVDITPRVNPQGVERIRAFMTAKLEGVASLEEAADAVAAYLPHRPRPKDLSGLAKNLRREPDGRYRWHWDPQLMSPTRLARARDPERLLAAARSLRVPTLLVRGKLSDIVSEETAAEFLAADACYVDVSGAGHMVAGDQNDIFSQAVIEFLCGAKTHAAAG